MKLRIETADAEKELARARSEVSASGLPDLLARIDRGAFGTTPANLEALDAIARALAVALAAAARDPGGGAGPLFLGLLLAEEAADGLRAIGSAKEKPPADLGGLPETQYRDLAHADARTLFSSMLKDCRNFVYFYQNHADAAKRLCRDEETVRCLRSYFRLISNTLRKLLPESVDIQLETPRLRFAGLRVSPLGMDEPADILPVGFDDIVGNADLVSAGRRLARDVAGFDLSEGKNPKKVRNQILFALGSPGCGKTVTAHAILRYFLGLCEKSSVPAKVRVIRRTDWASAYQNQSASRLLEIFRDEVFNAPGVCGAYWPDIDTAFAARSDSDIRQEEKANLATLFGILDGTIGPKNGKWFLLCDANSLHMDEATLSRLSQSPLKALGPVSPEDFVKLLRDVKLRGFERCLPIDPAGWGSIGARCVSEKLSGRSVDNIAGRILTEIEDFEEPEGYFSMSFEEKRKVIEKLSRPVSADRVQALIEEHCRFEREGQKQAEEERFQRRVDEIRLHLSAERAALGALTGKPDAAEKA